MGAGRVTQVRCVSRKQVNSMLETVMQQGGGGLMLRHPTAEYKGGRSTDLLKVKRFFDKDAVVIGYTAGTGCVDEARADDTYPHPPTHSTTHTTHPTCSEEEDRARKKSAWLSSYSFAAL
jgi:hypothetical protein